MARPIRGSQPGQNTNHGKYSFDPDNKLSFLKNCQFTGIHLPIRWQGIFLACSKNRLYLTLGGIPKNKVSRALLDETAGPDMFIPP